jgi:hypothetical protein
VIYLTIVCVAQVVAFGLYVWSASRERQALLQRIQAPEVAVTAHAMGQLPVSPPAVGWDDDEAHHVSREAMAEALR